MIKLLLIKYAFIKQNKTTMNILKLELAVMTIIMANIE